VTCLRVLVRPAICRHSCRPFARLALPVMSANFASTSTSRLPARRHAAVVDPMGQGPPAGCRRGGPGRGARLFGLRPLQADVGIKCGGNTLRLCS
jgi:hypothetical protein